MNNAHTIHCKKEMWADTVPYLLSSHSSILCAQSFLVATLVLKASRTQTTYMAQAFSRERTHRHNDRYAEILHTSLYITTFPYLWTA